MNLKAAIRNILTQQLADARSAWEGSACPRPDRWWAVALKLSEWTDDERVHLAGCERCLKAAERFRAELEHPAVPWLLRWMAGGLTEAEGLAVAAHVKQRGCARCRQVLGALEGEPAARRLPSLLRQGTSAAEAAWQ